MAEKHNRNRGWPVMMAVASTLFFMACGQGGENSQAVPEAGGGSQPLSEEAQLLVNQGNDAQRGGQYREALGYFRQPNDKWDEPTQGVNLSLMGRVSNALAVGVAGKGLWGPNQETGTSADYKDVDAGFLIKLSGLHFGAAIRNIMGGEAKLDQEREVTAGFRLGYRDVLFFSSAMQARWEGFSPYQYGFGIEYVTPYRFTARGGYRFSPGKDEAYWSAGLGFVAQRVTIQYALERAIQWGSLVATLTLSLTLFVDNTLPRKGSLLPLW